jgi:hypothetical protein
MKGLYVGNGKVILTKDGHTDVASAEKSVITIMQHCEMILNGLKEMSEENHLPTWWTNKIAISEYEIVSAANYLSAESETMEEDDSMTVYIPVE